MDTTHEVQPAEAPAPEPESARVHEIEHSLQTEFSHEILGKFKKAIKEYELLKPGDKVAVCISGGKDSMLMAKLFQELTRHGDIPFEPLFLIMDPGYDAENRAVTEANARLLGIPAEIFETDIFSSVYNVKSNPCFLCSKMRRGHLYRKAKELGCSKIALGHHFDDIIETILMSVLYGGQTETMLPKLHSANFEGMQLIRPMYFIRERDISRWAERCGLSFIQCACRFTEESAGCEDRSKRRKVKKLIAKLAESDPQVEMNIFRSVENIKLNKIISYKSGGETHSFLDGYND